MANPQKKFSLPNGDVICCRSKSEFDLLCREFMRDDIYDKHGIEWNDGDCVFDVGANIGFFSRYVTAKVRNALVYSFEPIPATFALLQKNIRLSNGGKVHVINCGISDCAGEADFKYFPLMSVNSTMIAKDEATARRNARRYVLDEMRIIHPLLRRAIDATPAWCWWPVTEVIRRIFDRFEVVRCSLRTLSSVIDEFGIKKIDLLKIDAEGAEQSVLDGLRNEHWPLVRQMVVETHFGPNQATAIAEQLRERGFIVVDDHTTWSGASASGQAHKQAGDPAENLHMLYARRPTKRANVQTETSTSTVAADVV